MGEKSQENDALNGMNVFPSPVSFDRFNLLPSLSFHVSVLTKGTRICCWTTKKLTLLTLTAFNGT